MDSVFIQDMIDFYDSLITNLKEQSLELSKNSATSYSLDTSQTKEAVKKRSMEELQKALDEAIDRKKYWEEQLNSVRGTILRPAW